jgi:hypothetical protein
MRLIFILIFAMLVMAQTDYAQTRSTSKYDRLPDNVTLQTEVVKEVRDRRGKIVSSERTTVEKRLNELKARYKNGRLVDGKGREIRFFEPLCRGVSAGFEEDQKAQKEKDRDLAELRKKYTVVVLYCNPLKAL